MTVANVEFAVRDVDRELYERGREECFGIFDKGDGGKNKRREGTLFG